MRVIAFSCCHVARPETQIELFDRPVDYAPLKAFVSMLLDNPPDVIVNLGDFNEPFYDPEDYWQDVLPEYMALLKVAPKVISLSGNHDPADLDSADLDGVRYTHGHLTYDGRPIRGHFNTVDAYVENIRRLNGDRRLVHGHTHFPREAWPLDVGSVTFTRTYGEIIDGTPYLRTIQQ